MFTSHPLQLLQMCSLSYPCLQLIEERFRGMFDFFYLPIDFKNKCNVGYAFINMVKPEYIIPLVDEFHGKRWPKFNSEKICHIAYGRIQVGQLPMR